MRPTDAGRLLRTAWAPVPDGIPRRDVAWNLLRGLVGTVEIVNPCPYCGGPHGPVQLPGAGWIASVSYADGGALVGVLPAAAAGALGIDAVRDADPGVDGVRGTGATARDWARVEAALKADRRGLRVDPGAVRVTADGDHWRATLPGGAELVGWDPPAPPGLVVSAAVRRRAR